MSWPSRRRVPAPTERSPQTVEGARVCVELVTMTGRAAAVEFRVRGDTVQVWTADRCAGNVDRRVLRRWLSDPSGELVVGEVTLTLDRSVDRRGRVAITMPGVRAWTLSPAEEEDLRRRV